MLSLRTMTPKCERWTIRTFPYFVLFLLISLNAFGQQTIRSADTGNWTNPNTWIGKNPPKATDNVIISAGHTVTLNSGQQMNSLTIEEGGVLTDNGQATTITGDIVLNGVFSGDGPIILSGNPSTLSGTGDFTNTDEITILKNLTILANTDITKNSGTIDLAAIAVTNRGTFTFGGSMTGVAGSAWTNESGSTLNIGGALLTNLSGTILNASAAGNTVNYYGGSQTVKLPSAVSGVPTYHHLVLGGSGLKRIVQAGNLSIHGNLVITSMFDIGTGSSRTINLSGDFINAGTFAPQSGTVVFSGNGNQTVTNAAGSETFFNMTVNKSGGSIQLMANVTVSSALSFQAANLASLITSGRTFTLGTSITSTGSLSFAGTGFIVGNFTRWIAATDVNRPIVFPLGTVTQSRAVSLTFASIASPGQLTAGFTAQSPGILATSLNDNGTTIRNLYRDGYWTLSTSVQAAVASSSFGATFNGAGFTGFTTGVKRLLYRALPSGSWVLNGSHDVTASVGDVAGRNAMNGLTGQYAFGSDVNCTPPNTSAITASSSNVCTNSTAAYSVIGAAGSTYTWTVPAGGTIVSGQGSNQITVNWGGAGNAVTISVVEQNSCTGGAEVTLPVNIHAIPPAFNLATARLSVPENGATPVVYEVIAATNYTYTWSVSGGTIASSTATSVSVLWGEAGTGVVAVQGNYASCGSVESTALNINKYKVIRSVQTGNWSQESTWDCKCVPNSATDNVTIRNTHKVTANGSGSFSVLHLNINSGGELSLGRQLTVNGDLSVNGTLSGSGAVLLTGSSREVNGVFVLPVLEGNATLSHTGTVTLATNRNILSSATLAKSSGAVILNSNVIITNNGSVTLPSLDGLAPTSTWINAANASLRVTGSLLSTGTLNASATGNTVSYIGAAQSVKEAEYFNLTLSGGGAKTLPSAVIGVKGNITSDAAVIPNSGTVEFRGNSLVTGTVAPQFANVIITPGSTLNAPAILNVAGNFVNNGAFNHAMGEVVFNGSTASNISGSSSLSTFYSLRVNNTAGVFNEANTELIRILNVGAGAAFDADGVSDNRVFTMLSTSDAPANDAAVGQLPAGARVNGKVTVQRYLFNATRMYRYLASPVIGATVGDWQDDISITGAFTEASSQSVCGITPVKTSASMFLFNETINGASRYVAYPTTATGGAESPLVAGVGYATFIRNNCSPTVIDVTGTLNQGDFTFNNLTNSAYGNSEDGYNLVGNPYASAIDWNSSGWDRNRVSMVAAIRDNKSGGFQYLTAGVNPGPMLIATGQAFWVQVLPSGTGAPLLTVKETAKSTATGTFYRQSSQERNVLVIELSDGKKSDRAFHYLIEGTETTRDIYDGLKFNNDFFDIFTYSEDNLRMAVNSVPSIACEKPVKIGLRNLRPGSYSLTLETEGQYTLVNYSIYDKYTGKTTQIEGSSYRFAVDSNPLSADAGRFTLYMNQKVNETSIELNHTALSCSDESAQITVKNSTAGVNYVFTTSDDKTLASMPGSGSDLSVLVPAFEMVRGENIYKVDAVLGCGSTADTRTAVITYSTVPSSWEAVSGSTCGSGSVGLSVTGVSETDEVRWFRYALDTAPAHTGTTFTTPIMVKSDTWFVEVASAEGCISDRAPVEAKVVYVAEPFIYQSNDNVLTVESGESVNWYFNEEFITNAAALQASSSGVFTAEVKRGNCTARSSYTMVITSLGETSGNVSVYPNPFASALLVKKGAGEELLSVVLFNEQGREIGLKNISDDTSVNRYDVSSLPNGLYVIKLKYASRVVTEKLVKRN